MQRRMRVEDDEVESFVVPDYFKVAEDVESRAYISAYSTWQRTCQGVSKTLN